MPPNGMMPPPPRPKQSPAAASLFRSTRERIPNTADLLKTAKRTVSTLAADLAADAPPPKARARPASATAARALKRQKVKTLAEAEARVDELSQKEEAEELEAHVEVARRNFLIAQTMRAVQAAERINLAFLFDATASMAGHIAAVKEQISAIVTRVTAAGANVQVHVAYVAYRDHCDGANRLEQLDFTSDINYFKATLGRVVAMGGGDGPEDVHGGLQQATRLSWSVNGAATRVLVHIADAPCHGRTYHGQHMEDWHPHGDPMGLRAVDLLGRLNDLGINYIFGRLNGSTDMMIGKFNEEVGANYITSCDMADVKKLAPTVVAATCGSMARTATLTLARTTATATGRAAHATSASGCRTMEFKPGVKPEPVSAVRVGSISLCGSQDGMGGGGDGGSMRGLAISTAPVRWAGRAAHTVAVYTNDPIRSLAQLRDATGVIGVCKAEPADGSRAADVRLEIAPQPFAQGAMRYAFHARVGTARGGWQAAIVKQFKDSARRRNTREEYLKQIEVSTVAAYLAEQHNKTRRPGDRAIHFLLTHVVSVDQGDGGGEQFLNLESALPAGEFIKFSNNTGFWDMEFPHVRELMRFCRWTHEVTGQNMMVTDLQGVLCGATNAYYLTDPVVLCRDQARFGATNLGEKFMKRILVGLDQMASLRL